MKEKVDYVKIGGDVTDAAWGEFGWVYTKSSNLYCLWWSAAWPDESTAFHQVRRSLWVSFLRDAMTNGWDVEFRTGSSTSAKVLTLLVFAP